MVAVIKTNSKNNSWLGSLWKRVKKFISTQREEFASRAASPTLTGINLIPDDYTPAKLIEHPGAGSHEDIEPMK